MLAYRPTPKARDHILSAVRDCLFNILAATLHTGGRSSIRNLRTRHAVVTGTYCHQLKMIRLATFECKLGYPWCLLILYDPTRVAVMHAGNRQTRYHLIKIIFLLATTTHTSHYQRPKYIHFPIGRPLVFAVSLDEGIRPKRRILNKYTNKVNR